MDWRPDGAAPPVPVAAAPVVPVDFTVVKRRLGGGGDMEVRDASGGLAFRFVAAAAAGGGGGGGRALLDAAGGVLVTVRSGEVMVCVCLFFFWIYPRNGSEYRLPSFVAGLHHGQVNLVSWTKFFRFSSVHLLNSVIQTFS